MTVEQLVRWRAKGLWRPDETTILEALSVEGLKDEDVPSGAYDALRKFRHYNTADRRRCIRRALRGT